MSSSIHRRESDATQPLALRDPAAEDDGEDINSVPRRFMRVKVLYTFDDQNKSNCLARLPNPLNIPTVSLDETTQVGVIQLKACIQAIVAASPELVAKLGHDYTVYAYDYSEYETPLVGQGMLSWILAAASATPNAPADQSQTMVTGRVCKNILGLFSNGIKETLEVKLKLIPVPTCMQREYVENMERYHSLSQMMPEGMDYNAWADFLQANPALEQMAQPVPGYASQSMAAYPNGDMQFQQPASSRPMPSERPMYTEQPTMAYNAYESRPSSPAMSTASFNPYQSFQISRPASRGSFHGEPAQNHPASARMGQDEQDEGPPKKRVCVTQATRPKKPTLAKQGSLRVTASTAASVRLHRPVATASAAELATMEQVPRAPTPRPGDRALPRSRGLSRVPTQSLLRHASMDEGRSSPTPFDSAAFSDIAVDSADDDRGNSPGETPMDIPSSPPVMPQRFASSVPSSPGLPSLAYPPDSGFVSDMPLGQDGDEKEVNIGAWEGSDLPTASDTRYPMYRRKRDNSRKPWMEVTPGPTELLPTSYIAKPKTYPRPSKAVEEATETANKMREASRMDFLAQSSGNGESVADPQLELPVEMDAIPSHTMIQRDRRDGQTSDRSTTSPSVEPHSYRQTQHTMQASVELHHYSHTQPTDQARQSQQTIPDAALRDASVSFPSASSNNVPQPSSRASTPNPVHKRSKYTKARGLPRSHTWSGEPMSDAVVPESDSGLPRSGAGARRKQNIADRLQQSIEAGVLPTHCNNCGEIETPTWRKAYTRVDYGTIVDMDPATDKTGILGCVVVEPTEDDSSPRYRIYKASLSRSEAQGKTFEQLCLCNPCGLWLNKTGVMRPPDMWVKKPPEKKKRKRYPPKNGKKKTDEQEGIQSDAAVLYSEPVMPVMEGGAPVFAGSSADAHLPYSMHSRASSFQGSTNAEIPRMDGATAFAALHRAIQSSPVVRRGSQDAPIDLDPDLTPKPTRRLLFPSPRRAGETKSLADAQHPESPTTKSHLFKPGDIRSHATEAEDTDKENCPPRTNHDNDDLAHLFEEHISPKTTPTKGAPLQDLIKTPTPGSRRRPALTPKRGAENNADIIGLTTPSRNIFTPNRSGRAATVAPETPFTRQLNALLSDCLSSPSQHIDFSVFPTFNMTPGRNMGGQFTDFNTDDFLSSDLPIPSSPPAGLGFSLYEDPATSTVGLWSGASMFEGSDAITMEEQHHQGTGQHGGVLTTTDISVDFAAMIEGVVGKGSEKNESVSPELSMSQLPEQSGSRLLGQHESEPQEKGEPLSQERSESQPLEPRPAIQPAQPAAQTV